MDIKAKLEEVYARKRTIKINETEKLILAICYKNAKTTKTLSKLLGLNIQTVRNYISNLKTFDLIRQKRLGTKRVRKFAYIFEGTKEQLSQAPQDVKKFIKNYWGDI